MSKYIENNTDMLREQGNNDPIYYIFDEITKAVLSKFRGVKDDN